MQRFEIGTKHFALFSLVFLLVAAVFGSASRDAAATPRASRVLCQFVYVPLIEGGDVGAISTAAAAQDSHCVEKPPKVDFNGDGYGDLAVGIQFYDDPAGGGNDGAVEVFYGTESGLIATATDFIAQGDIEQTPQIHDEFGGSLAAADFNSDGYTDLAIGAPGETIFGRLDAGQVTVLYGSEGGLRRDNTQRWHQGRFDVGDFVDDIDQFGHALGHGDFNGDGYEDLAVGSPTETELAVGVFNAGAAHVFYGGEGGLTSDADDYFYPGMPGMPGMPLELSYFGGSFGSADFDGDGYDDLAIGAQLYGEGAFSESGAVYVLRGGENGIHLDGSTEWRQGAGGLPGDPGPTEQFGTSLTAGDLNNDGVGDLVIGVWLDEIEFEEDELFGAGGVHILFGSQGGGLADGENWYWHRGLEGLDGAVTVGAQFGRMVEVGDFDGDGHDDLAVGVAGDEEDGDRVGSVQVFYNDGDALSFDGQQVWKQGDLQGTPDDMDTFGESLAANDMNGDGADELAVGAPRDFHEFEGVEYMNAGGVNVLYGSGLGLLASGNQYFHAGQPHYPGVPEGILEYGNSLSR